MNIVLYPSGGLGNRMRAIDSAVNLNSRLGRSVKNKLSVIWYRDSEMKCDWKDVFKPVDFIKDKSMSKLLRFVLNHKNDNKIVAIALSVLKRLRMVCVLDIFDGSIDYLPTIKDGCRCHTLIVRSCITFCPSELFHNELFEIKDRERLNRELSKVDANTIGIHIRRTDNSLAVQHSPLELFVKMMKTEMEADPDVHFYLCSDDEKVKNVFRADIWREHCRMPEESLDRDTIEGVVQAACEMQALAACKKIYGSYWSSFGGVAARMGRIENIIVSDVE